MRKAHKLAVATGIAWTAGVAFAHATTFTAGAGRADIAIPADLFPIDGFAVQHDPLAVRVLLLDDGQRRIGLVVVDQTSMSEEAKADIKAILNRISGAAADNIIVTVSHGFSAPHVFPAAHLPPNSPPDAAAKSTRMTQAIDAAVEAAAKQASTHMQAARVGYGQGVSRVAVNRDVQTPNGWWLGGNDAGFSDTSLGVLRIDSLQGRPLAILMNYSIQSSVLDFSVDDKGQRVISSDLAGQATRYLENHYGNDAVAMFIVGAAGDQAPYLQANPHVVNPDGTVSRTDTHSAGFALLDLQGERLGQAALTASEAARATDESPVLQLLRSKVQVTSQENTSGGKPAQGPIKTNTFVAAAPVDAPITLLRIGDVAIAGVMPEMSASTGAWIKAHSPFGGTLVATMFDGGAKYMPDAASYDRITYEARGSRYARGSAETVAAAIVDNLKAMHDQVR